MIFTAYFDEADTHGPAPTVILAAFVGHAYQWRRFETKLARLQEEEGFRTFHTKDFKGRPTGEFEGWSDDKRRRLTEGLKKLVSENLTEGITVFLERERYMNEYRAPPIPRKMNLDSQYGVCFRACLGRLLQLMQERGNRDRLNIVMERGHNNVWDCKRIFCDLKAGLRISGESFLGDFAVASKENCPPLMVADMLAGVHSIFRGAVAKGEVALADFAVRPGQRKGTLVFLELQEAALAGLKTGFEELRGWKVAQYQARRQARQSWG